LPHPHRAPEKIARPIPPFTPRTLLEALRNRPLWLALVLVAAGPLDSGRITDRGEVDILEGRLRKTGERLNRSAEKQKP